MMIMQITSWLKKFVSKVKKNQVVLFFLLPVHLEAFKMAVKTGLSNCHKMVVTELRKTFQNVKLSKVIVGAIRILMKLNSRKN